MNYTNWQTGHHPIAAGLEKISAYIRVISVIRDSKIRVIEYDKRRKIYDGSYCTFSTGN
jgi:hypothetical protein